MLWYTNSWNSSKKNINWKFLFDFKSLLTFLYNKLPIPMSIVCLMKNLHWLTNVSKISVLLQPSDLCLTTRLKNSAIIHLLKITLSYKYSTKYLANDLQPHRRKGSRVDSVVGRAVSLFAFSKQTLHSRLDLSWGVSLAVNKYT